MSYATKTILLVKTLKFHIIIISKTANISNILFDSHEQALNLIKQWKASINLINNILQNEVIEISKRSLFSPYDDYV